MIAPKPVRLDPRIDWFADVRVLLSPMSGVTNRAFRDACRPFGMDMGFCEFASAAGLNYESEATWRLIDTDGEEGRVGIQIFGSDPGDMAAAARSLSGKRADVLDINFGCPAKKVVKKCGGSALLADLPLLERIVRAVVAESGLPATAKIRSGWDDESLNYAEVGQLLQDLGCCWVTLHGRTRRQKYRGMADWDHIAELVEAVDIPVIGNGDVVDGETYLGMARHTRCHAVMVGRGAIGNPWIFEQMQAARRGEPAPAASWEDTCRVMQDLVRAETGQRGERVGLYSVRKHLAKCFRGMPGARALRQAMFAEETSEGVIAVLEAAAARGGPDHEPLEETG